MSIQSKLNAWCSSAKGQEKIALNFPRDPVRRESLPKKDPAGACHMAHLLTNAALIKQEEFLRG